MKLGHKTSKMAPAFAQKFDQDKKCQAFYQIQDILLKNAKIYAAMF